MQRSKFYWHLNVQYLYLASTAQNSSKGEKQGLLNSTFRCLQNLVNTRTSEHKGCFTPTGYTTDLCLTEFQETSGCWAGKQPSINRSPTSKQQTVTSIFNHVVILNGVCLVGFLFSSFFFFLQMVEAFGCWSGAAFPVFMLGKLPHMLLFQKTGRSSFQSPGNVHSSFTLFHTSWSYTDWKQLCRKRGRQSITKELP